MRVDRPPPGEELNPGPETSARDSASVIVLRDGASGVEVLLVKRNPKARFMGGAWVFPGGAVGPDDPGPAEAGLRELTEEAGVSVGGPQELAAFSRWITPAEVKIRYDTRFYVTRMPEGAEAVPDGSECVDAGWWRPADALDAHARDEMLLVFPTIKHLEELASFGAVEDVFESVRDREIAPVQPRIVQRESGPEVLLPGEPGYEAGNRGAEEGRWPRA
jgi:8-oxo-dGTP pyrophosphatase MutT (NUDIX family)